MPAPTTITSAAPPRAARGGRPAGGEARRGVIGSVGYRGQAEDAREVADLEFDLGPLGEWGIIGHARLETEGPLFLIEGSLTIASQELISGRLEIDDNHIYLETTFDLPTVFGFDFGEITVSAELVNNLLDPL